ASDGVRGDRRGGARCLRDGHPLLIPPSMADSHPGARTGSGAWAISRRPSCSRLCSGNRRRAPCPTPSSLSRPPPRSPFARAPPPVITMGRGSHAEHVLAARETLARAGATVWETTRGGDVTYHGPGQLVGYGIVDLREHGRDVGRYLRELEEGLIRTLGEY